MATDAQTRLLAMLTQTCSIQRAPVETGDDLDLILGALATVDASAPCLFCALRTSDDMTAAGRKEQDIQRLLLLPDQDLQRKDTVTDGDGVEWIVEDAPQLFRQRGIAHHLEATVVRKAVQ